MKIVILVAGLPPWRNGGTEIATAKIAKFAAQAGHEVHVIAWDFWKIGKDNYKRCTVKNCEVHWNPAPNVPYVRDLVSISRSIRLIAQLKPDFVHVQGIYMAPAAFMASLLFRIPYVYYERGGIHTPFRGRAFYYRLFLAGAQRIIAQTENQKAALLRYCKRKIEVIPNGIEAERFGGIPKEDARRYLAIPLQEKVVTLVGRCRPEKNVSCFVKAALMDDTEDTRYMVIGDGPQQQMLENMAHGRVRFMGSVPNDMVHIYLSASDVLVNTSLNEGFPVAVLEAMASGLPIVAPRVSGLPEIITEGENGLLTTPNSPSSTYVAVRTILVNSCRAREMSQNNKRKALSYTWENVVEKLYGKINR